MVLPSAANLSDAARMRQKITSIDELTSASENAADAEWMSHHIISRYGKTHASEMHIIQQYSYPQVILGENI